IIGFDSGKAQKDMINDGTLAGAITQNPVGIVCERSLDADHHVFAKMLRDDGCLESVLYDIYVSQTATAPALDSILYLDVNVETCLERIQKRGRVGEKGVQLDYLRKCETYYASWITTTHTPKYTIQESSTMHNKSLADQVIDIGPGAGIHGGKIVAQGTPEQVAKTKGSLTGEYLSGKRRIAVPKLRTPVDIKHMLRIRGASGNNLKNIDVDIPVGLMTCITGVSGSGKSTLINDTLYPIAATQLNNATSLSPAPYDSITGMSHLDKVVDIDQSPIGRTPRSNPATYVGLFSDIRDLFAESIEAKTRGYKPGRFSFNVKGGRCEACEGDGVKKVEMHFLPDVYVTCDTCKGQRYNRETLEIKFKNKNIHEVLEMTVEEAQKFFEHIPSIAKKLSTLMHVGLSYLTLGQRA
ncbi:hypothetical protein EBR57_10255, partial [bacterium]|nr:hypothetical protein [bacterium]